MLQHKLNCVQLFTEAVLTVKSQIRIWLNILQMWLLNWTFRHWGKKNTFHCFLFVFLIKITPLTHTHTLFTPHFTVFNLLMQQSKETNRECEQLSSTSAAAAAAWTHPLWQDCGRCVLIVERFKVCCLLSSLSGQQTLDAFVGPLSSYICCWLFLLSNRRC